MLGNISTMKRIWFKISNTARILHSKNREITPDIATGMQQNTAEFMAVWPDILRDLTDDKRYMDIPEVTKWFRKVLQYNVPNFNNSKSLIVPATYKLLEDPNNLTPENIKLANIMGWCVEILQSSLLVQDDITNALESRRGILCWYKQKKVDTTAINDSILLEHGSYFILKKYLSKSSMYIPCVELCHDVMLKTAMGTSLDILSTTEGKSNLNVFTVNRYDTLVKYKTGYYGFLYPATLGMYLTKKFDPELYKKLRPALMQLGHLLQVQNDFLDCFGNALHTGKLDTDIAHGKCSWLIVTALQRAATIQKKTLQANYGRTNLDAVLAVKGVYEELDLPSVYATYEEEKLRNIRMEVEQISKHLPYTLFLEYIYSLAVTKNWTRKEW